MTPEIVTLTESVTNLSETSEVKLTKLQAAEVPENEGEYLFLPTAQISPISKVNGQVNLSLLSCTELINLDMEIRASTLDLDWIAFNVSFSLTFFKAQARTVPPLKKDFSGALEPIIRRMPFLTRNHFTGVAR